MTFPSFFFFVIPEYTSQQDILIDPRFQRKHQIGEPSFRFPLQRTAL